MWLNKTEGFHKWLQSQVRPGAFVDASSLIECSPVSQHFPMSFMCTQDFVEISCDYMVL